MKKFLFSAILVGFAVLSPGCPDSPNNPPVDPTPTPVVTDTELCSSAEEHLQGLCKVDPAQNVYCCQVVAPTKKGKSFTQVCTESQNNGVFFNPKCLMTVTSCDQIDKCTKSK